MKRLIGALALLALAGCAHGTSAHLEQKPPAPIALVGPEGLDAEQAPVLEAALCQGLVEAHVGEVSCPSATREVLEIARMRAMGGSAEAQAQANALTEPLASQQVHAVVTREGGDYLLTLTYAEAPGGPARASQTLKASSFEALVSAAPSRATALVR